MFVKSGFGEFSTPTSSGYQGMEQHCMLRFLEMLEPQKQRKEDSDTPARASVRPVARNIIGLAGQVGSQLLCSDSIQYS